MPAPLQVGLMAFTATDDVAANAARVAAALTEAAAAGARVLMTPECALTGYPGAARETLADLDAAAVAQAEADLVSAARDAGLALLLGTVGQGTPRPTNDALWCGSVPVEVRYRKRCLTPLDAQHFTAGDAAVVADVEGWRLGLAVCYDLRFPRAFADLALAGADAFLVLSHMAGPDPDPGTKAAVIPALCASRAAEWATPLALCNTAAADRWLDSGLWDPRGMPVASRAEGLAVVTIKPRDDFHPWYRILHTDALAHEGGRETKEEPT